MLQICVTCEQDQLGVLGLTGRSTILGPPLAHFTAQDQINAVTVQA